MKSIMYVAMVLVVMLLGGGSSLLLLSVSPECFFNQMPQRHETQTELIVQTPVLRLESAAVEVRVVCFAWLFDVIARTQA